MKKSCKTGLHPLLFFRGYSIFSVSAENSSALLNACRKENVSFISCRHQEEKVFLTVPFFDAKKVRLCAKKIEVELLGQRDRGLPALIYRHRRRLGIPLGIIISLLMIFYSSGLIWDVRIDGSESLDHSEILSVLSDCGLSVGTHKSSLNVPAIENRALILSDDIAWISINVIGTVAHVEVRPLVMPPNEDDEPLASNIVAAENGIIVGFENTKGNLAVHIGDAVSRGELLIGGIYGEEGIQLKYISAKGKVLAEVDRTLTEQISRSYVKKSYTGAQKCEKYLVFFEKEIKIFSNYRNLYPTYDKIDTIEYICAPNGDNLPIAIRTVRYMEYTLSQDSYSDTELETLASYKLKASLTKILANGELLSKKVRTEISSDGISVECKIRSIENIAKIQEIEISGITPSKKESAWNKRS